MTDQLKTPAESSAPALSVVAGSQLQLVIRRDEGRPRLGYYHRTEISPVSGGGMRLSMIPDPKGDCFTTICEFDYYNAGTWPERIVAALANKKDQTPPTENQ